MGSRRRAREQALQALYSIDMNPDEAAARAVGSLPHHPGRSEANGFTWTLVNGYLKRSAEIDGIISRASLKWGLDRMAVVDRNILRLATYELLAEPDTPSRVILNEAIELAKSYGGEDSGTFVNGILDRIREDLGRGA